MRKIEFTDSELWFLARACNMQASNMNMWLKVSEHTYDERRRVECELEDCNSALEKIKTLLHK